MRNPDHTAIVNAVSTMISAIQVVLIVIAVRLLRRGGGMSAIGGGEMAGQAKAA